MTPFNLSEAGERGWFVGQFDKAVFNTDLFEAGLQSAKKGEYSPKHTHKIATEINLIVSGKVMYGKQLLSAGEGIIYYPGDVCECYYLEDTVTMVIKTPGALNDKYVIEE